jgi:hypothetical protein
MGYVCPSFAAFADGGWHARMRAFYFTFVMVDQA